MNNTQTYTRKDTHANLLDLFPFRNPFQDLFAKFPACAFLVGFLVFDISLHFVLFIQLLRLHTHIISLQQTECGLNALEN